MMCSQGRMPRDVTMSPSHPDEKSRVIFDKVLKPINVGRTIFSLMVQGQVNVRM
jgi:hypothetical protein